MAVEKPKPLESEEQSIKARKNQLFEAQAQQDALSGPKKPLQVYLRDTPAMPISPGVKATLWGVGALVLLLFLAALATRGARRERPRSGSTSSTLERWHQAVHLQSNQMLLVTHHFVGYEIVASAGES
jgi:hypothetical protein